MLQNKSLNIIKGIIYGTPCCSRSPRENSKSEFVKILILESLLYDTNVHMNIAKFRMP